MNAKLQYKLSAADLELILALVRTRKLAEAGERLALDASTVFRTLQRIERGLGANLFERSRQGYAPGELALALAAQAEQLETLLETARASAQLQPDQLLGTVRITTTDGVLHQLVAPALPPLLQAHPQLRFELHAGNELASLTRRDADIAVRATQRPPAHLIGKKLGPIRMAPYAAKAAAINWDDALAGRAMWIAPDDGLPEHPSVLWRQRHLPKISPQFRVGSIMTVMELIAQGLGVGLLPIFMGQAHPALAQIDDEITECQTELWLLTHAESRHLRRVSTVYTHLAENLKLV
ncbi:LysR family transcriptional regulator [Chitinibacter bivalviorum]|uniref:LysR family transcriptional regulator n=1 Tax=Chitinibacter bivalviorum TaxID=2739434 RepID=A0A7H9BL11_9NEIS|nr:LysR family transcriptional regulator [Chitinibacter bivalviorum]QLG89367.1 LysR family transcriptional regulator [Chitinibacter bivalviorum]